MKKRTIFGSLLFLAIGFGVQCGGGQEADQPSEEPAADTQAAGLKAVAQLNPTEGNNVTATVTFEEQADGSVHVTANVNGLTAGKHGFHIHETGDCSAPDAGSAGGHFNPDDSAHGAPDSESHHAGDLGNLEADESGSAEYHATYSFFTLQEGARSVIGKAVIVHAGEDDLVSQPTGDAGARLACGVITAQ